MKPLILVCLSAFLVTVTIGCSDSNSSEGSSIPSSIRELFPLNVGNEWYYDVGLFDSNGTADRYQGYELVVSLTQQYGREMFVLNDSALYYYVGDSEVNWLDNRGDSVGKHYFFCPRYVGESKVMYDSTYYGSGATRYWRDLTFVRSNETLETPAGTFSCFYFESASLYQRIGQDKPDTAYFNQYWLVKNIGLVRQVRYTWYSGKKTLDYTLWLRKYHFF